MELTGKAERLIRERALEQVFGKLKKSDRGSHGLRRSGQGDETTSDRRAYRFGDALEQVAMSDSIRNAQQRGIDELRMSEDDLEVVETEHQSACATVLMIDISHSMILYGEDRITPAKKVAMALAELIAATLSEGHVGHCGLRQRCLAGEPEGPALLASGTVPYQYRRRAGTGHGHPAPPQVEEPPHRDDHRWQAELHQAGRRVLHEQHRTGRRTSWPARWTPPCGRARRRSPSPRS